LEGRFPNVRPVEYSTLVPFQIQENTLQENANHKKHDYSNISDLSASEQQFQKL